MSKPAKNKPATQTAAPVAENVQPAATAVMEAPAAPAEGEETAESLPAVEDTPQQAEVPATEKATATEKQDGRGRPKGMLFSFSGKIGEILKECPELGAMWHTLSEKRKRTGEEIQALMATAIAEKGVAILTDTDFLKSLPEEEIGETAKLKDMAKNHGDDFDIEVGRGQVKKYFEDRVNGVFARLAKLCGGETALPDKGGSLETADGAAPEAEGNAPGE